MSAYIRTGASKGEKVVSPKPSPYSLIHVHRQAPLAASMGVRVVLPPHALLAHPLQGAECGVGEGDAVADAPAAGVQAGLPISVVRRIITCDKEVRAHYRCCREWGGGCCLTHGEFLVTSTWICLSCCGFVGGTAPSGRPR